MALTSDAREQISSLLDRVTTALGEMRDDLEELEGEVTRTLEEVEQELEHADSEVDLLLSEIDDLHNQIVVPLPRATPPLVSLDLP